MERSNPADQGDGSWENTGVESEVELLRGLLLEQRRRLDEQAARLAALEQERPAAPAAPDPSWRAAQAGSRISRAGLLKAAGLGVGALLAAEVSGAGTADAAETPRSTSDVYADDFVASSDNTTSPNPVWGYRTIAGQYATLGGFGKMDNPYTYGVAVGGQVIGVLGYALDQQGSLNGGIGVEGKSSTGHGVLGITDGSAVAGVHGTNTGSGPGISATSSAGHGLLTDAGGSGANAVHATHTSGGTAVYATTAGTGATDAAVYGQTTSGGAGVYGEATASSGAVAVLAKASFDNTGLSATSDNGTGVFASAGAGPLAHSGVAGHFALGANGQAHLLLAPGSTAGAPTGGYHNAGEIYMDSAANLWVCISGGLASQWKQILYSAGTVTDARVESVRATRDAGGVRFHWHMADGGKGVAGFHCYAGTHRLTNRPIPAHAGRSYRRRFAYHGAGPFILGVVLEHGGELRIEAG